MMSKKSYVDKLVALEWKSTHFHAIVFNVLSETVKVSKGAKIRNPYK